MTSSSTPNIVALIPVALFIIIALAIAYGVRPRKDLRGAKTPHATKTPHDTDAHCATKTPHDTKISSSAKNSHSTEKPSAKHSFLEEYFLGNKSLGGFVLAMTCIATYGSVSSFVGGPGQAFEVGFGWVYMSCIQVTSLFLLYGIMGKKLALVSRKLGAITLIDVIRARYKSDVVANMSAVIIVLFFIAMMVAQFVGGAKIFEAVTGYSYVAGLALFGLAAVIYTSIGGFRGVVLTDTLCGIAMLVCIGVLAYGLLNSGGGLVNIIDQMKVQNPQLLDPFGGGNMPLGLYFTQWLLVGVFTFALPQSAMRCMGVKDEKSLRSALVIGTVIIGVMMITVTALGVLAHGALSGTLADYGGSVDNIIPAAIVASLPPWLCGIAIIGPIAASISTVSSLLIMASSSIVKDIILHTIGKRASGCVLENNGEHHGAFANAADDYGKHHAHDGEHASDFASSTSNDGVCPEAFANNVNSSSETKGERPEVFANPEAFANNVNNMSGRPEVFANKISHNKGSHLSERKIAALSQIFTFCIGILVFVLAIVPPDVIWKINMFAFGGLESAFCWVLVAGLYWRRANKWGAILSMLGSTVIYCTYMALQFAPFGLHQIVLGISSSLLFMIIGSFIGKKGEADGVFFVD